MSARAKTRTAPPKAAPALVAEFDGEATAAEPRSLSDVAYEAIKHRITTCAFKPGEVINKAGLSALARHRSHPGASGDRAADA